MSNYKLLSGVFEGNVVEEGTPILDVSFDQLDGDMQLRIRHWAEGRVGKKYILVNDESDFAYLGDSDEPINMNQIKKDYELSWESTETEEDVDLIPVSKW